MAELKRTMNSIEFDNFLKSCTVKITTCYSTEAKPIQGTGTVHRSTEGRVMIITAKHCLRGENFEHQLSDIIEIQLDRSFPNIKASLPFAECKILESNDDLAIIIISNEKIASSLCPSELDWKIGFGEFHEDSEFIGYGYQSKLANSGSKRHDWKRVQAQDLNPNQVDFRSLAGGLSPNDGDTAIEYLEGYSGTGLFLNGTDSFCFVEIELLDQSGIHDRTVGIVAELINSTLSSKGYKTIEAVSYKLVNKNSYDVPEEYINRTIGSESDRNGLENISFPMFANDLVGTTLIEEIKKKDRIILLADGGVGKSTDLKFLASQLLKEGEFYPVLLQLKNRGSRSIEQQMALEFPDWNNLYPKSNIVIIVDGYEEGGQHKDDFREGLLSFITSHDCKVVVACRSSFYVPTQWERFEPFTLHTLIRTEIEAYVNTKLPSGSDEFLRYVSQFQLDDLVKIPFYLVRLVELFLESGGSNLPKSKSEIIQQLIENKLRSDRAKYGNTSIQHAEIKRSLDVVGKVALRMQELNISAMGFDELEKLLNPEEIQKCEELPIARIADDFFSFDHDIFKDYFAAKALSKMEVSEAIGRFTFSTDDPRIVPRFSGSLVFLLALWKEDEDKRTILLNHLLKYDPRFILALPRGELGIEDRLAFFKRLFESFLNGGGKKKDFWNVFSLGDLVASVETNRYLIELIRSGKVSPANDLPWRFFRSINRSHDSNELVPFLTEYLHYPESRFHCVKALENNRLLVKEDARKFAEEYFDSEDLQERELTLYLINNHNLSDELASLLFKEWDDLVDPDNQQVHGEEGHNESLNYDPISPFGINWKIETSSIYRKSLLKFKSEENIRRLLDYCRISGRYSRLIFGDSGYEIGPYDEFWKAACDSLESAPDLFDIIYARFKESLNFGQSVARLIARFFVIAELQLKVLDLLIGEIKDSYDLERALEVIVNEDLWNPLIDRYEGKIIGEDSLKYLVSRHLEPSRSDFRELVEARTGLYSTQKLIDDEAREARTLWETKRLGIFLGEDSFLPEVKRLFELAGIGSNFTGYASRIWRVENDTGRYRLLVFATATQLIWQRIRTYDLIAIETYYSSSRAIILLSTINQLYKNEKDVLLPFRKEIQEILDTLVTGLSKPSIVISPEAKLVYTFWKDFEFDIPSATLLDLTMHEIPEMPQDNIYGSWKNIENVVGKDTFSHKVLNNLSTEPLSDPVLNAHLIFCRGAGLIQSLDSIVALYEEDGWENRPEYVHNNAILAIDSFTTGEDYILEELLKKAINNDGTHYNDHLVQVLTRRKNHIVVPILENLLDHEDERLSIDAAFALLHFESQEAMQLIVNNHLANKEDRLTFQFQRLKEHRGLWILPFLLLLLREFTGQDQIPKQLFSIPALIVQVCLEGEQFDRAIGLLQTELDSASLEKQQFRYSLEKIISDAKGEKSIHNYEKRIR